ncbi:MAG: hypothetical protein IT449_02470 [Phycisphaerales bacterium]|nr:hypothetical protein [Phycisphaerales bacterium]
MMDKRTRILAIAFSALIGLWFGSKTVYSWWIKPLFTIQEDIEALRTKRDEANEFDLGYRKAQWEYEKLVSRVGAMQVGALKGDLHRRLEELAHKHHLNDLKVAPKLQQKFGKTECTLLGFTISGQQKLADVLGFLKDVYELPHLMRVLDPRLQPVIPPRDKKPEDLVKISLEVQALLLPPRPRPKLDYTVNKKDLVDQPSAFARHGGVDVMALAERKPFLEYEAPKPARPTEQKQPETSPGIKPPPALTCKPWKGSWKIVAISMMHEPLLQRVLAQDGTKTSSQKYIAPGEEFDGGMLDTVSTLAALVRYHDGNYVYPLGGEFKDRIKAEQADRYPMLKERAATLPPLSQDEIKALPGKAGKTVTASTASTSSSKSGSDKKGAPSLHRTPSTGSNGSSSRTTTTPGRLSSPARTEPGSGTKGIPATSRPTGSAGSPPPGRGDPDPAAETPAPPDTGEEAEGAESTGENLPAEPAPAPSPPGPPDNM